MNRKGWLIGVAVLPLVVLAAARNPFELRQILALTPDIEHGGQIYAACAVCHGTDGGGQSTGSVPRIAGQHYGVVVRQILEFRSGKHWDMRMEDVAKNHRLLEGPQDIADVSAYVAALEKGGKRGISSGIYVERGAAIYAANCADCHGAQGEGSEAKAVPRLAGQHAAYLMRQIYDAVDGRRPELSRTHRKRLGPLSFEDVLGVTDYLARIGWQPEEPFSPAEDASGLIPPG